MMTSTAASDDTNRHVLDCGAKKYVSDDASNLNKALCRGDPEECLALLDKLESDPTFKLRRSHLLMPAEKSHWDALSMVLSYKDNWSPKDLDAAISCVPWDESKASKGCRSLLVQHGADLIKAEPKGWTGSVDVHRDSPMACCWWEVVRARQLCDAGRATPRDARGSRLYRTAALPIHLCEILLGHLFADPGRTERALLPPWPTTVPRDWLQYSTLNPHSRSSVLSFVRTASLQTRRERRTREDHPLLKKNYWQTSSNVVPEKGVLAYPNVAHAADRGPQLEKLEQEELDNKSSKLRALTGAAEAVVPAAAGQNAIQPIPRGFGLPTTRVSAHVSFDCTNTAKPTLRDRQ